MYTFAESRGIRVRDDNPFQMKFISATTLVSSPKYMSHSSEWLFAYMDVMQYWTLSPVDFCNPTVILMLSNCIMYIFRNGF